MDLLIDKTTRCNIAWATNQYGFPPNSPILREHIDLIQPRYQKAAEVKAERTKKKAEVFTPSWVCNNMINLVDDEWFGRKDVFNVENGHDWAPTTEKITFPAGKTWQDYVTSTRLEITCGEAPYLVSRYDTATGEPIPLKKRMGMLDRKLRVVGENTDNWGSWLDWAYIALKCVYGYEYQGDNLYLARLNVLMTFGEYLKARCRRNPTIDELEQAAEIITWNLWQMDGLTDEVPGTNQKANIMDWTIGKAIPFASLKTESTDDKKTKKYRRTAHEKDTHPV